MTIHCVAFVGKNNEPLFLSSSIVGPLAHDGGVPSSSSSGSGTGGAGSGPATADALQLQCIAHSALDIIEEKRGKKPSGGGAPDMFLGHLFPAEDFRVYGYITNTLTKIIAICDPNVHEPELKEFFQRLHQLYVCEVQNPFQDVGQPVSSVRFSARIQSAMDAFHAKEAQNRT